MSGDQQPGNQRETRDAKAGEGNGGIAQQDRINRVLTSMVGRPVPEPRRGLAEMLGDIESILPPVPDFKQLPNPPAYAEIKYTLSELKKAKKANIKALIDVSIILKDREFCAELDKNVDYPDRRELSVANIIAACGVTEVYIRSSIIMACAFEKEIEHQESILRAHYPRKGSGRPIKNVYAYQIAHALAQFYWKARKEKPGYGFTDGYPTGRYMVALQEIFEILGVDAGLDGPAKAACEAVEEQGEIEAPGSNPPLSGLFGLLPS